MITRQTSPVAAKLQHTKIAITPEQFIAMTSSNWFDVVSGVPGYIICPFFWYVHKFTGTAYTGGSAVRLVYNGLGVALSDFISSSVFTIVNEEASYSRGTFNVPSILSGSIGGRAISIQPSGASFATGTAIIETVVAYYALPINFVY